jgi:hypothetical protein
VRRFILEAQGRIEETPNLLRAQDYRPLTGTIFSPPFSKPVENIGDAIIFMENVLT